MESNLSELETQLTERRAEVTRNIEKAKEDKFDEQFERAQSELEKWHESDHNLEKQIRGENESYALRQMANQTKMAFDHKDFLLRQQLEKIEEKSIELFSTNYNQTIEYARENLILHQDQFVNQRYIINYFKCSVD